MNHLHPQPDDRLFDEHLLQQLDYALVWIGYARQQLMQKSEGIKQVHDDLEREGRKSANEENELLRELQALGNQRANAAEEDTPPHELEVGWDASSEAKVSSVLKVRKLKRVQKKRTTRS
ncbi:hypothetical protein T440DRAFT_473370 [Plenodomus tracheiphilus IPT5]|uniref:Uncharacterized protein n=1 Tax=Plenodomus tracheiphilus IPT5 TaxID=1408161 RepID=A0A6A7AQS9_9PLEO|nr:hypothetical protein T440DRAFT_473370 [Plenodomus tracheiphilus IPT5]